MRARKSGQAHLMRATVALCVIAVVLAGCSGDNDGGTIEPEGTTTEPAQPTETIPDDAAAQDDTVVLAGDDEHRVTEPGEASVQCDGGGEVHVLAAASVTITGQCDEVDIDGDGATVSIEASDDVDIDGSENNVSADEIGDLDIGGDRNTVDVATVREIDVEGDDNTVAYGGSPGIDDEGDGNTIESR